MTRRAVVHIGMPRTASTTFQHVLAHLGPALLEAGILYPALTPRSAAREPHFNHQHLGEALDGRRPAHEARELLDALAAQLTATEADTVVLSYEDWVQERRAGGIAATLDAVLARHGFRMEALVVAKPQDEHLNSVYAHRAQLMREKRDFAGFARGFLASRRFAYAELLDPWMTVCDGRVRGVPLRDRRSGAPLLHRILAEAGLAERVVPLLEAGAVGRVENRSPGPVAVEVSRRLRRLRMPFHLAVRPRAAMREIEQDCRARGLDAGPFRGVDAGLRARMTERFAATNERYARMLWGAAWADVVAPEPAQPVNELAGRTMAPETEQAVDTLVREACARHAVPCRKPWYAPLAEAADDAADVAQRRLRLSRWRVI